MGENEGEDGAKGRAKSMSKHIVFEDGSLDGSDEDERAVEVTFEPGNPYRRKSSLVSSDVKAPLAHRLPPGRRAECIVHQLLEAQRRGKASSITSAADQYHTHPIYANQQRHVEPVATAKGAGENVDHAEVKMIRSMPPIETDPQSLGRRAGGHLDLPDRTGEMSPVPSGTSTPQYDNVHSRMLTKKQLSDMAWGVRELSRRLSSMRLRFRARSILILTKIYDQDLIPKTRALTQWLLDKERPVKYVVYVQDKLKTNKKFNVAELVNEVAKGYVDGGAVDESSAREGINRRLRYWDEGMCRSRPHMFDFVITLGGDGTVLYASWLFQRIVPPVLSFALGSLGFLTKFDFENYQSTLNSAFNKGVTVSLRLRFESTVMRSIRKKAPTPESSSEEDEDELHRQRDLVEELIGEEREDAHTHRPDGTFEILNEVVVDRGPNATMSSAEIFGDDEHFTSVLADGICVSTPTGSTAYNLAAGGSLCHPDNPVMLVTAICAHTLSFRPIILPDTIVLRVGVPFDARTSSWASFDGRERVELRPGDYVTISASRFPFASVQEEGRRSEDWVNSISGKLGWNTRQKQKNYKSWL